MKTIAQATILTTLLALAGCGDAPASNAGAVSVEAIPATASWTLASADSRIAFASIKAGEVIETHFFPGLTGSVSPTGEVSVDIPLDRVETKIDIRNERMRDIFFETSSFPVARIAGTVDLAAFSDLPVGERLATEISATLSLHGNEVPVDASVFVTRIHGGRVEVASAEPVVLYLADFELEAGLEVLRNIANLPSITASSPVTFTFVFDADEA